MKCDCKRKQWHPTSGTDTCLYDQSFRSQRWARFRRGLSRSSWHLKPIALARHLHQVLKPKNIGTWDAMDIAKRRVKHHPFRHCFSRFFTGADDLQCTLYSTLCSGSFLRKFCESRCKVDTIPYRTGRMISRVGAQSPGTGPDRGVHCTTKS